MTSFLTCLCLPALRLVEVGSRTVFTRLANTQLANHMFFRTAAFTAAQDGVPEGERLTRNLRVGCDCVQSDLFLIPFHGPYEVSRSHIYAELVPGSGLTCFKVDLTRVNSSDRIQS